MKQSFTLKKGVYLHVSKFYAICLLAVALLSSYNTKAQITIYYTGNATDIPHYRVVENDGGGASFTPAGSGIKITSTASNSYYTLAQRMNDASRSYIDVSDLFPTNDTSGIISFKIVDQPAIGKLIVRLGLYSVNNDCSIVSMPIEYSGKDAERSTEYTIPHQVDGTTYIVDLSSNEMRTQINAANALALLRNGPFTERVEGFVLKFGWASYTGSQSYITIDSIVYRAPTNLGVTPVTCFNTGTILPVTLKSFDATPKTTSVSVSWATASEKGNTQFTVERATDSRNFSAIGTVISSNNASGKEYSFEDVSPIYGTAWYRLRMTDKDGTIKYSPIKAVFLSRSLYQSVMLQTNNGLQSVNLSGWSMQQPATLSLVDAAGRTIKSSKVSLDSRVIQVSDNVPSGVYLVRLQQGSKEAVVKIVL